MRDGAPLFGAVLLVETVHFPAEWRRIVDRRDVAVEADLERFLFVLGDGRRDAHHVAPHDWAGVRQTGNRDIPADILPSLDIPPNGQREALGDAARADAAELWPVDPGLGFLARHRDETERAHEQAN